MIDKKFLNFLIFFEIPIFSQCFDLFSEFFPNHPHFLSKFRSFLPIFWFFCNFLIVLYDYPRLFSFQTLANHLNDFIQIFLFFLQNSRILNIPIFLRIFPKTYGFSFKISNFLPIFRFFFKLINFLDIFWVFFFSNFRFYPTVRIFLFFLPIFRLFFKNFWIFIFNVITQLKFSLNFLSIFLSKYEMVVPLLHKIV